MEVDTSSVTGQHKSPITSTPDDGAAEITAPGETHRPQDRQSGKTSRRVRACRNCRARKIKCDIDGKAICQRCSRYGLECIVDKSLHDILNGETDWKNAVESQLQSLHTSLAEVKTVLSGLNGGQRDSPTTPASEPHSLPEAGSSKQDNADTIPTQISEIPRLFNITAMTRENSPEASDLYVFSGHDTEAIGGAPAASLFEVTKLRNVRNNPAVSQPSVGGTSPDGVASFKTPDFIDSGRVALDEADRLFTCFRRTLNAYLWGGIGFGHQSLESVRVSSSLLTAAVLAVTALHQKDNGQSFDRCYTVFLELVGQCVFQRYHSLDDIRALCVGAFWLSDVSWKLSGLAVRLATELKLHQACSRLLRQEPSSAHNDDIEAARLWYFLYLCDHHFSILYGRPPAIHEDLTIAQHETLLQVPGITRADYRLHSQVAIFKILGRAYKHFRPDYNRLVTNDDFETVRAFESELGHWRSKWVTMLASDPNVASYPSKGVHLHYHFARLQLLSMCLRGLDPCEPFLISPDRLKFISGAIKSAISTLEIIINDSDISSAIIGMPFYLVTTISYAAVFLMRVHSDWRGAGFPLTYGQVVPLLQGVIDLLGTFDDYVKHVALYIGKGLSKLLARFKKIEGIHQGWVNRLQDAENVPPPAHDQSDFQLFPVLEPQSDWNEWMLGGSTMVAQLGLDASEWCNVGMQDPGIL